MIFLKATCGDVPQGESEADSHHLRVSELLLVINFCGIKSHTGQLRRFVHLGVCHAHPNIVIITETHKRETFHFGLDACK